MGATYDYLKNGKSKIFTHYGRFFEKLPNEIAYQFTPRVNSYSFFSDSDLTNLIDGYFVVGLLGPGISEVEGHGNSTSPFSTRAQYTNEWTAGVEQEVKSGFSLGAHFIYRNLGRVVENMLFNQDAPCIIVADNGCVPAPIKIEELNELDQSRVTGLLTNVDGHIPGLPALVRDYKAFEITVEKRFTDRWQLMGSYQYAHLTGNYEGGDANIGPAADFALSPLTRFAYETGPLSGDIRNMVKLFSAYQWRRLNTGISFYFQTGKPITALGEGDLGVVLISPRGSYGRTDSISSVDVRADYSIPVVGNQQITLAMDVFNLFNSHGVTDVDQLAESYGEPLKHFLSPETTQPSRSIRFLLRYSF